MSEKKKVYARIIEKNAMFVDEPIFANELSDKAKNILNKYSVGKLLVSGDNRYLCDDLMRLFGFIVKSSALNYADVVKCAVVLGKRQFALEVLPSTVLELALDRSHIYKTEEKTKKKRWFR